MVTTIMVVEDEAALAGVVRDYLVREDYTVLTAGDGPAALDLVRARQPDVVILDVMLPGLDGVEVCRRLRQFSDAYVLMLTAQAEEIDKIVVLSAGADDYLTKPFSPRELVARVKALLRRPRGAARASEEPPVRRFGALVLDEGRLEVAHRGAPVGAHDAGVPHPGDARRPSRARLHTGAGARTGLGRRLLRRPRRRRACGQPAQEGRNGARRGLPLRRPPRGVT